MKNIFIISLVSGAFFFGMITMNLVLQYSSSQNPVDKLVRLVDGFLVSRALYVIAELQIADELVNGPKTAYEIANNLNLDGDAVFRLLRMLVSHGVFIQKDDKFALNDLAELITIGHSQSMHGFLLHEDSTRWNSYAHMSYSIKTGKPTFNHLYGCGYFDFIARDKEKSEQFDRGMATFSDTENKQVSSHFDFTSFPVVVDVGGGVGGLIAQILDKNENIKGVLYELPHLEEMADNYFVEHDLVNRTKVVTGSFLENVVSGGDLYLLKRILHDWNDEICVRILQNCAAVMHDDSEIVVFDCIVPDDSKYDISKDIDVIMMVVFGGKERTEKDFEKLFAAAGLQINKISSIPGTMLSSIEGSKKKI